MSTRTRRSRRTVKQMEVQPEPQEEEETPPLVEEEVPPEVTADDADPSSDGSEDENQEMMADDQDDQDDQSNVFPVTQELVGVIGSLVNSSMKQVTDVVVELQAKLEQLDHRITSVEGQGPRPSAAARPLSPAASSNGSTSSILPSSSAAAMMMSSSPQSAPQLPLPIPSGLDILSIPRTSSLKLEDVLPSVPEGFPVEDDDHCHWRIVVHYAQEPETGNRLRFATRRKLVQSGYTNRWNKTTGVSFTWMERPEDLTQLSDPHWTKLLAAKVMIHTWARRQENGSGMYDVGADVRRQS